MPLEKFDSQAKTPKRWLRAWQQLAQTINEGNLGSLIVLAKPSGLILNNAQELAVDPYIPLILSTETDPNAVTYNKLMLDYGGSFTLNASNQLILNTDYPANGLDLDSSELARVTGWQQRSFSSLFPAGVSGVENLRCKLWMQGGDVVGGDTSNELRVVTGRPGYAAIPVSLVTLNTTPHGEYQDFTDAVFTLPRGAFYAGRCWEVTYFGAYKSPANLTEKAQVKFRILVQTDNSNSTAYTVNAVVPSFRDGISTGGLPDGITAYSTGEDVSGGADLRWLYSISGSGGNAPVFDPVVSLTSGSFPPDTVVFHEPLTGCKWISGSADAMPGAVITYFRTTINLASSVLTTDTLPYQIGNRGVINRFRLYNSNYPDSGPGTGGVILGPIVNSEAFTSINGSDYTAPFTGNLTLDANWDRGAGVAGDNILEMEVSNDNDIQGLMVKWGSGNEPDPNATWMLRLHFFTRAYSTSPQMVCFYEFSLLDGPNLFIRRTVGGSIPETVQDIQGIDLDTDTFLITLGVACTNDRDSADLQFAVLGAKLEMK